MYDSHDDVIYVGKAVKLKRRVSFYFRKDVKKRGPKIESMVQKISRFEYILTDSELEALILECNLIKDTDQNTIQCLWMIKVIRMCRYDK